MLANYRVLELLVECHYQRTERNVGEIVDCKGSVKRLDSFVFVHVLNDFKGAYCAVLRAKQLKSLFDCLSRGHYEIMEGCSYSAYCTIKIRMVCSMMVVVKAKSFHCGLVNRKVESVGWYTTHHQYGTAREEVLNSSRLIDLLSNLEYLWFVSGLAVSLHRFPGTLMLSRGSIERCYESPAMEPAE